MYQDKARVHQKLQSTINSITRLLLLSSRKLACFVEKLFLLLKPCYNSVTMAKTRTRYVCQECGSAHPKWMGRCPDCGEWNTLLETIVETIPRP
jgi:lipopolysaccharide biosynthesis regulator YciM